MWATVTMPSADAANLRPTGSIPRAALVSSGADRLGGGGRRSVGRRRRHSPVRWGWDCGPALDRERRRRRAAPRQGEAPARALMTCSGPSCGRPRGDWSARRWAGRHTRKMSVARQGSLAAPSAPRHSELQEGPNPRPPFAVKAGGAGGPNPPAPFPAKEGGAGCARWGGRRWAGRGEDRSSKIRNGPLRGAILRVLAMLSCHALSGSARWGAWRPPCSTGRAGGGRAWVAGARETEPSSARRGRAGPVLPDGDVKPSGGPAEQRVLESAL